MFSCSVHTCVHYILSEALCCVEVSTELSHNCHHVIGDRGFEQVSIVEFQLPSFLYIMCALTYRPIHNDVYFHYDVGR